MTALVFSEQRHADRDEECGGGAEENALAKPEAAVMTDDLHVATDALWQKALLYLELAEGSRDTEERHALIRIALSYHELAEDMGEREKRKPPG